MALHTTEVGTGCGIGRWWRPVLHGVDVGGRWSVVGGTLVLMSALDWKYNDDGVLEARSGHWIATITEGARGAWATRVRRDPHHGMRVPPLPDHRSVELAQAAAAAWISRHS